MPKREFKILLAITDQNFATRVAKALRQTYSVQQAKDIKDLSAKVHKYDFSLIIIDYRFSGMKAEDVYQGVELLHPNALFVIYTQKDKRDLAMKVWKRRALDYIVYTRDIYSFAEEVNKCVRWILQKTEATYLGKRIDDLADSIKNLSRRIDRTI